jgi:transmembrane sensor
VIIGIATAVSLRGRRDRDYVATARERLAVTLSDGTQFVLAPASRLRVAAGYGISSRDVVLDGEAFFTVVHDTKHPFAVHTARAVATDVGTAFDVRAYRDDPDTRVAVSTGQVSLAGEHGQRALLGASDLAIVGADGTMALSRRVDVNAITVWTAGTLAYRDVPARMVVADVARWYGLDLHVDATLAAQQVTVTLPRGVTATRVLEDLCDLLGAHVDSTGGQLRLTPTRTAH